MTERVTALLACFFVARIGRLGGPWQAVGSVRGGMEVDARRLGRPPRVFGERKANNISDEPPDGAQHVDPGIVGAVAHDD